MPSAMHSDLPSCGRRRKPALTKILSSKEPLRATGGPADPVCPASRFRLRLPADPGPRAPRRSLAIVCAALALNPVRPRLRGIQALYVLDPAGAVIHLCGLPRRRGGAPHQCGLQGLFGDEPAARARETSMDPLISNISSSHRIPRRPHPQGRSCGCHGRGFGGRAARRLPTLVRFPLLEPCYASVPLRPPAQGPPRAHVQRPNCGLKAPARLPGSKQGGRSPYHGLEPRLRAARIG